MEVKQVRIGRVSNKAFLLFVVDSINSEHIDTNYRDEGEFSMEMSLCPKRS
jgi:hypothetical protein